MTHRKTDMDKRMDSGFSVFNLHVNDAGARADREFILQFGWDLFEKHIKPLHAEGIMLIFHSEPNIYTSAWVSLCTAYVNENRA